MTRRPVFALLSSALFSGVLLPALLSTAPACAAPAVAADPEASQAAIVQTVSAPRHRARTRSGVYSRTTRRLPSRGLDTTVDPSNVVGRLAVIVSDNTPIKSAGGRFGRVLSVCPRGQSLAISGQTDTEYAVLMADRSTGFVDKASVQLLNYQVVNNAGTLGARLVQTAQTFLGVPYVWGGETRSGIDCSGFVRAVYAANGLSLPRVSGDQAGVGYDVPHDVAAGDWTQWAPGDRMYFACHHPRIDHTGMYIGSGLFIHASVGHSNQVAIDRVDNAYYSGHLVAVRRSPELLNEPAAPGDQTAAPAASFPSIDPEANQQ